MRMTERSHESLHPSFNMLLEQRIDAAFVAYEKNGIWESDRAIVDWILSEYGDTVDHDLFKACDVASLAVGKRELSPDIEAAIDIAADTVITQFRSQAANFPSCYYFYDDITHQVDQLVGSSCVNPADDTGQRRFPFGRIEHLVNIKLGFGEDHGSTTDVINAIGKAITALTQGEAGSNSFSSSIRGGDWLFVNVQREDYRGQHGEQP